MQITAFNVTRGVSLDDFNAQVGDTIRFSVDAPTIKRIKWEFGDGTTSNLIEPTHVYFNPITYNVKVTVWVNKTRTIQNCPNSKSCRVVRKISATRPIVVCEFLNCRVFLDVGPVDNNSDKIFYNLTTICVASPSDPCLPLCEPPELAMTGPNDPPVSSTVPTFDPNITSGPFITTYGLYTTKVDCQHNCVQNNECTYPTIRETICIVPDPTKLQITPLQAPLEMATTFTINGLSSALLPVGTVIKWYFNSLLIATITNNSTTYTFEPISSTGPIPLTIDILIPGCSVVTINQPIEIISIADP